MGASAWREDETLPADLRDALTRSRLAGAVSNLAGVEVVDFNSDWWDGQSHAPCLVVRGGRRHRLLRVIETHGEAVVVPFDKRMAQRWIAERRRPVSVELGVPAPRDGGGDGRDGRDGGGDRGDVVVDATTDVRRCDGVTCGALLPVGYDGACPVCGCVGVSEEKSTATGARTAGSSTSK
jgi:hypothetical protein